MNSGGWGINTTHFVSATTSSSFLFLLFLEVFLRKIRDLQQRFATDAAHHLSYQR
jgi:hypothetical protein